MKQAKAGSVNWKKDMFYHFVREYLCVSGFRHNLKVIYHHFISNVESFSKYESNHLL